MSQAAPDPPPPAVDHAVLCPHCLYDLRGSEPGRCPECGQPVAAHEALIPANELAEAVRRWREAGLLAIGVWLIGLCGGGVVTMASLRSHDRPFALAGGCFVLLAISMMFATAAASLGRWLLARRRFRVVRQHLTPEERRRAARASWLVLAILIGPAVALLVGVLVARMMR